MAIIRTFPHRRLARRRKSSHPLMRIHPSEPKRLEILNSIQNDRPWRDCREKRRCIACRRVFRGEEVVITWQRARTVKIECPNPKCGSAPALWVRLGNPLTNEAIWKEW